MGSPIISFINEAGSAIVRDDIPARSRLIEKGGFCGDPLSA